MAQSEVMWVGLSAKNDKNGKRLSPLDAESNSGKLISMIETQNAKLRFHRTNLVKYTPLDSNGKLRYPNRDEVMAAMPALVKEIQEHQPQIIFLLGKQVGKNVLEYLKREKINFSATICEIYHPSYIYVYRRKQIDNYICEISKKIEESVFEKK